MEWFAQLIAVNEKQPRMDVVKLLSSSSSNFVAIGEFAVVCCTGRCVGSIFDGTGIGGAYAGSYASSG